MTGNEITQKNADEHSGPCIVDDRQPFPLRLFLHHPSTEAVVWNLWVILVEEILYEFFVLVIHSYSVLDTLEVGLEVSCQFGRL